MTRRLRCIRRGASGARGCAFIRCMHLGERRPPARRFAAEWPGENLNRRWRVQVRRAVKRGGVVAKGVAKAAVFGPPMKVKAAAGGAVGGVRDLREKREQRMLRCDT